MLSYLFYRPCGMLFGICNMQKTIDIFEPCLSGYNGDPYDFTQCAGHGGCVISINVDISTMAILIIFLNYSMKTLKNLAV